MKKDPMGEKHYVYSARTTREVLELLNKIRGGRGWDAFVNEAVCGHYKLDPAIISPPLSKYWLEREEKKKEKEEKTKKRRVAKKTSKEAKNGCDK